MANTSTRRGEGRRPHLTYVVEIGVSRTDRPYDPLLSNPFVVMMRNRYIHTHMYVCIYLLYICICMSVCVSYLDLSADLGVGVTLPQHIDLK